MQSECKNVILCALNWRCCTAAVQCECTFRRFISLLSMKFRHYDTCHDVWRNAVQQIFTSFCWWSHVAKSLPYFNKKSGNPIPYLCTMCQHLSHLLLYAVLQLHSCRLIFPANTALSSKPAAARGAWWDRGMLDHFIDPAALSVLREQLLKNTKFVHIIVCCWWLGSRVASSAATSRRHCFSHRTLHHSVWLYDRL